MRISQAWVSKWLREGFVLGVLPARGAGRCRGAPAGSGQCWGARRVPGGCAVPVPVSAEIEMKENFLSHCPSYKSMRERERKISPRDQQ